MIIKIESPDSPLLEELFGTMGIAEGPEDVKGLLLDLEELLEEMGYEVVGCGKVPHRTVAWKIEDHLGAGGTIVMHAQD